MGTGHIRIRIWRKLHYIILRMFLMNSTNSLAIKNKLKYKIKVFRGSIPLRNSK